jgi:anti-anti-sigma factor
LEPANSITVKRDGQATLVRVGGELDIASSQALERELSELQADTLVIVDLRDVSFIDSTALGVLVRAHQLANDQRRRLGVVYAEGQVSRLLSLTGLEHELLLADSPEQLHGGS